MYAQDKVAAGQPRNEGCLASALSTIEARLVGVFDQSARINVSLNQLLNPRPEGVTKPEGEAPVPDTIEGRLHNVAKLIEKLGVQLSDHASRIDSAV